MYQHPTNSSSSSPQRPSGPPSGLARLSSAPGSFLTRAVDSVMEARGGGGSASASPSSHHVSHHSHNNNLPHPGQHQHHQYRHQYVSWDSSSLTSESACKASSSGGGGGGGGGSALVRQKSSPAGFLRHLVSENGFSITRVSGGYNSHNGSASGHAVPRLKSQLSFTGQDSLSQISQGSESGIDGISSESRHQNSARSYSPTGFGLEPWDNGSSIAFSGPPSKRVKGVDDDLYNCLNALETQFSLPQTAFEMATMDKLLSIPEDSVRCKIRAKRGCATHPRSIAERERRTRISGKLKKLQELVPNMDKQTSYADMLDLAVQHIKGLQDEVERLHKELENCRCGCKQPT